jgi:hypothetical protein
MAGPTGAEALQHVHAGLIRLLDAIDIACRRQENPEVHRHLQVIADALQHLVAAVADFHNGEYSEIQPLQGGTPPYQDQLAETDPDDDAREHGLKHCPRAIIMSKVLGRLVAARRARGLELEGANARELKTLRMHLKNVANYINMKQAQHDKSDKLAEKLQKENEKLEKQIASLVEQLIRSDDDHERELDRMRSEKQVDSRVLARKALRRA